MIDPVTTLAVSMQTKKGAFALLLGSGISRSAQIPTGWDIVLDLIRRVAKAQNSDPGDDLAAWYTRTFNEEPDYSVLLGRLAQTPAERSQIIRKYIEPNQEERNRGLKVPTEAHRAIAELVADGYVRVIVTTNFDRLLEAALGDMGVVPAIIDSADAVKGTLPLVHNACTIIKVHGDYVDARIRNTSHELEKYPGPINRLLDQVFSEYGLIVCGWSGEWDAALRGALQRRHSPWFSTYWISNREPRSAAQSLIDQRNARVVVNMDADTFFQRLAEGVTFLEDLSVPELASLTMARAAVKRYIDDPSRRVRLRDLVVGEANGVRRAVEAEPIQLYRAELTREEIAKRLQQYEKISAVLRTLFATGCYWGEDAHEGHWIAALERLANFPRLQGQPHEDWERLRYYPALLVLYTGGIAAIARGRYETLRALLYRPTAGYNNMGQRIPLIFNAHPQLLSPSTEKILVPNTHDGVVIPQRIRFDQQFLGPLQEYLPDDDALQTSFDRFEYFFGLVHTDLAIRLNWRPWGPLGWAAFRDYGHAATLLIESIDAEIQVEQTTWPPLQAGLFGGSLERLLAAKKKYDSVLQRA